jgi:hypothetical protein
VEGLKLVIPVWRNLLMIGENGRRGRVGDGLLSWEGIGVTVVKSV